jgi:hypothetical protein
MRYTTRGSTDRSLPMRAIKAAVLDGFGEMLRADGLGVREIGDGPRWPRGQGFIAPTSLNWAGNVTAMLALAIVTTPSSKSLLYL